MAVLKPEWWAAALHSLAVVLEIPAVFPQALYSSLDRKDLDMAPFRSVHENSACLLSISVLWKSNIGSLLSALALT